MLNKRTITEKSFGVTLAPKLLNTLLEYSTRRAFRQLCWHHLEMRDHLMIIFSLLYSMHISPPMLEPFGNEISPDDDISSSDDANMVDEKSEA